MEHRSQGEKSEWNIAEGVWNIAVIHRAVDNSGETRQKMFIFGKI